jgi:hypothetical protein
VSTKKKFKWRKWNNIIHRDLGYICVGLTVIYAVSGVAVNHVADWNPNYRVQTVETSVPAGLLGDPSSPATIQDILTAIAVNGTPRATFRPDLETLQIFVDDGTTVYVNLETGAVLSEMVRDRRILREANFLHLNHPKKLWTYFADAYAVALALLAVTGVFVLKGKKGITGRGAWLTGAGVVIPVVFLWLYL